MSRAAATREIELSIGGMSGAAYAARIEKKLSKLGDVPAAVDYATRRSVTTWRPCRWPRSALSGPKW